MSSELFAGKVHENNSKRKWNGDKNNSGSSVIIDKDSTSANSESFRKVFENGSLVVVSNAAQHNAPLDFSTKKRKLDEKIQSLHFTDGQRNCALNNINHLGTVSGPMKDFISGDIERQSRSATTPTMSQVPNNPADPFHQNYAPSINGRQMNGCQMQYNNFLSNLMLAHYRNLLMNSHLGNVINQEHSDRPHSTASSPCLPKRSSKRNPGKSTDIVNGFIRQTKIVSTSTPLVTSTTDESRASSYVTTLEPLSPASSFLNGSPMYLESDCNSTECSATASPMPRDDTRRKRGKSLPEEIKNECYWERRRKNNEAAKKSRDARRTKEDEISIRSAVLEEENFKLQAEVTSLKAEVERLKRLLSSF